MMETVFHAFLFIYDRFLDTSFCIKLFVKTKKSLRFSIFV